MTTFTGTLGSGVENATYTIDASCNGTAIYPGGGTPPYTTQMRVKFYASPKGDSFTYIDEGQAVSGSEYRVSR